MSNILVEDISTTSQKKTYISGTPACQMRKNFPGLGPPGCPEFFSQKKLANLRHVTDFENALWRLSQ
jgi:hypothetical protein